MIKCLECGREFKSSRSLSSHFRSHNLNGKDYYDKYMKKISDGKCLNCNGETRFSKDSGRYYIFCCKTCANVYNVNKIKESNISRYGFSNVSQVPEIRKKQKDTMIRLFGTEYPLQNKEIHNKMKNTMKERYNGETTYQSNILNNRIKNTLINKCGFDHYMKSDEGKLKIENTMISKYGVDNCMKVEEFKNSLGDTLERKTGYRHALQNPRSRIKQVKSCFKSKKYILPSGKEIHIQGEEPQFLDFVFNKTNISEDDIMYIVDPISYLINNKKHMYYPDFFISKLNLIVEIKSSYILKVQTEKIQELKRKSCILMGFNYLLVVDRNYSEFNSILKDSDYIVYE